MVGGLSGYDDPKGYNKYVAMANVQLAMLLVHTNR